MLHSSAGATCLPGHLPGISAQPQNPQARGLDSSGQPHRMSRVRKELWLVKILVLARNSPAWTALLADWCQGGGTLKFWGMAPKTQDPLSVGHRAGDCSFLSKGRIAISPLRSVFVSYVSICY